jgi:hypothetical protein
MLNQFQDIVKVPYTTLPRMQKYEGDLIHTPPSETHMAEKKREFIWESTHRSIDPKNGLSFTSDTARKQKLVKKVSHIFGFETMYEIIELGSMIQEDIVIVHHGKIEAACVAFPSGWNPASAQGKTLQQLHEPVADGEVLRLASNRLTELMCGNYCYHRWVWTLTDSKYLSAHPAYLKNTKNPENINDLWWRTEHQITFPIEKGTTSGFLINVNVTPFTFLSQTQQDTIKESINTMSEAVLQYKKLNDIKQIINA